jgi:hypothetical protein
MCIIVFKKIDNKNYIAKNRDKSISTNISIIHEIVDHIEIVYMYDVNTYWVEGMNEFGIGAVNSTLAVKTDEIIDKSEYQKRLFNKKRHMLKHNNLEKLSNEWLSFSQNSDLSRHGHTLLCDINNCIHIESFQGEIPFKEKIINDTVFTNHGDKLKNKGYIIGNKYMSSLLRKELAYNEIINVNNKNEILNSLNKNYIDINPEFHTYRNKKQTLAYLDADDRHAAFNTTSQTLMCLSELLFYFNYDQENSNFLKYDNRLPINYVPKIKVFINKISKCKNPEKMPFNATHIEKIIEMNMYKKKNILFYCITLILLLIIYITIFDKF